MKLMDIDWAEQFRTTRRSFDGNVPGSNEAKAHWDSKASSFAHKPKRSDYIHQLTEMLALEEGDVLFDMGCGSGTLAIPVAKAGHDVIAVDFSDGMLAELERVAEEEGVADRITTFQRSWQQDWDGLPMGDVAVSSRSFVTDDLADGIAKLEGQARKRAVLTCGAGDLPYRDAKVLDAMGREDAFMPPIELATIANYLWMSGRLPRIDYIAYPGVWHKTTKDGLREAIRSAHSPKDAQEVALLDKFLGAHMVFDEKQGWWTLDYPRDDRWAVITWDV